MYLDPKLSEELTEKWKIPKEIIETILVEYKSSDTKRALIKEMIESEWNLNDD